MEMPFGMPLTWSAMDIRTSILSARHIIKLIAFKHLNIEIFPWVAPNVSSRIFSEGVTPISSWLLKIGRTPRCTVSILVQFWMGRVSEWGRGLKSPPLCRRPWLLWIVLYCTHTQPRTCSSIFINALVWWSLCMGAYTQLCNVQEPVLHTYVAIIAIHAISSTTGSINVIIIMHNSMI